MRARRGYRHGVGRGDVPQQSYCSRRTRTGYGDEMGSDDHGSAAPRAPLRGTCQDMCPLAERQWREKERLLHPFEVLEGTENDTRPKADRNKAVKQFSRSAAGQREATPQELRPSSVLLKTTAYLMRKIVPSSTDANWADSYQFVWDRLWAVRQDMTIQGLSGSDCIQILEQAVRFYVYAAFRSFEEDINTFDPHINGQHLQECLKRLLVQYQGCCDPDECANRPEMEAIYVLHNLGSSEALTHALSLPKEVRTHRLVRISLDASQAHMQGNFIRVLRAYKSLPILLACALHSHLEIIRRTALQVLTVAYSSQNCKFPLTVLGRWLRCSDGDARGLCHLYQLPLQNTDIKFLKGCGDFSAGQTKRHRDSALMKTLSATDVGALLCPDDKGQLSQVT